MIGLKPVVLLVHMYAACNARNTHENIWWSRSEDACALEVKFRCCCCCCFIRRSESDFRVSQGIYVYDINRQIKHILQLNVGAMYAHAYLMETTIIRVSIIQLWYAHSKYQFNPLYLSSSFPPSSKRESMYFVWKNEMTFGMD